MGKICGLNTMSYERVREKLEEDMNTGIPKSRSVSLSWTISDVMVFCHEEGLSFGRILKMAEKTFKWEISRKCVKCKKQFSPDDQKEGKGYCAVCIPPEVEKQQLLEMERKREMRKSGQNHQIVER